MIMHYILLPDFFNELYVLELPSLDSQKKKKKKKKKELPSPGIHMNQACWFLMDTQPPRY